MIVVIEGPDNSGKTTQANRLLRLLVGIGYSAKLLREPGGTLLGEQLRDIVLTQDLSQETLALLFSASRRHMMETHVLPSVERGEIVILDRFYYSQLVYQEINRPMNAELCEFSSVGQQGDIKILLSPIGNYEWREKSEPIGVADQDVIWDRYKKVASEWNGWSVVDPGSEDEVFERVAEIVLSALVLTGDRQ